jgi:CRP-like cAMP-binding protein
MYDELKESSCFQDLNADQIASILPYCSQVILNDGDIMIHEGEQDSQDLFLLISGAVEIVSSDSNITSSEVVLSSEDKDLFGEISWLTGGKRTASARCRGDVEAIKIDGNALMQHLEKNSGTGFKVLRRIALILSRRLEESDSLMKQLLWNANI